MTDVLYTGEVGHRYMQTRRTPCKKKDRDWGYASINQGMPENHQKRGKVHETGSLSQPLQRTSPVDILLLHFLASEHWHNKFLLFEAPDVCYYIMATLAH